MPSYAPDIPLLQAARHYVADVHEGVTKRAAIALSVEYVMLRRFLVAGCAKPENRQKIRNALGALDRGVAKDRKFAHEMPIEMTRSLLSQLLEALDAYESVGSGLSKGAWSHE